ncbi:gluconokinase [Trichormus variabilis ARAD]|nr:MULTISPECIES: gluconokinase [Nostocaceae]MBC1216557.1 gluconokinase [Trichormus variabilis ARAD]MBC1256018.1 gluconokinase [Trichormus variabilis V5]MBC1267261.1 gluconokinase [Trichormus variabilis FSR]MBC1302193.1 gluconokinase [Trichormus variabilis N2B]MBC1310940.1 gluconokinase [Trichormus variabilis PNB]
MIIIIMGVSGSGKTTIGQMLAESLHWEFYDADSFHSLENIEKMRRGIPLDDADRIPWLQSLQTAITNWLQNNRNVVLACSALKASYRQFLLLDTDIKLVYLQGTFELIQTRLQKREHHFMNVELLTSQFASLEEPDDVIRVDISQSPQVIIQVIKTMINV